MGRRKYEESCLRYRDKKGGPVGRGVTASSSRGVDEVTRGRRVEGSNPSPWNRERDTGRHFQDHGEMEFSRGVEN